MHQCMRNLDWLLVGEIKEVLEESHSFAGEVPVSWAQPSCGEQGPRCPCPGEPVTAAPQPAWGDVFQLRAFHAPPPACESPWSLGSGVGGEGRWRQLREPTTFRGLRVCQLTSVGHVQWGTGTWSVGTDSSWVAPAIQEKSFTFTSGEFGSMYIYGHLPGLTWVFCVIMTLDEDWGFTSLI